MLNIVMFGPPGSGKGTQSKLLAEKLNLVHISTGDIFRQEMEEKTELGILAARYIDKGHLVPDEVLAGMFQTFLDEHNNGLGFVCDGFPRTLPQAHELDQLMLNRQLEVSLVLALDVEEREIIDRMIKRATTDGRADDTREIIHERLKVYRKQTQPLMDYYQKQGKLHVIRGMHSIDEIHQYLLDLIRQHCK